MNRDRRPLRKLCTANCPYRRNAINRASISPRKWGRHTTVDIRTYVSRRAVYIRSFWRSAEMRSISHARGPREIAAKGGKGRAASACRYRTPNYPRDREDQFPIIRGTRVYMDERGNKYDVYTANGPLARTRRRRRRIGCCRNEREGEGRPG